MSLGEHNEAASNYGLHLWGVPVRVLAVLWTMAGVSGVSCEERCGLPQGQMCLCDGHAYF